MEVHTFNNSNHRCSSCALDFRSQEDYRQHYRTEFHRYNVKRKMVGLLPATLEQFTSKKAGEAAPKQEQSGDFSCRKCNKSFGSAQTYQQHMQSKKHREMPEPVETKRQAPYRRQQSERECLFCNNLTDDMNGNLKHMEKKHGFFVPQSDYCKDVKGLLLYLHEKTEVGLLCLYCENKGAKDFTNGQALRNHMKDKGHTFMKTDEGFEEYEKFYDFSQLFKQRLEDQKNCRKLSGLDVEQVEVEEPNNENDDEWEDDESVSETEEAAEKKPTKPDGVIQEVPERKKPLTAKYLFYQPTLTANGELLLPNGKLYV